MGYRTFGKHESLYMGIWKDKETPTGLINGSNADYDVAVDPVDITLDGDVVGPEDVQAFVDSVQVSVASISGTTVTLSSPPPATANVVQISSANSLINVSDHVRQINFPALTEESEDDFTFAGEEGLSGESTQGDLGMGVVQRDSLWEEVARGDGVEAGGTTTINNPSVKQKRVLIAKNNDPNSDYFVRSYRNANAINLESDEHTRSSPLGQLQTISFSTQAGRDTWIKTNRPRVL